VDDGHVCDANALGHGQEDVPSSTQTGGGAIGGCARAVGDIWEVADGGLKCRGNACPVHSTAQNPCQDVEAQRGLCSQGRAPHAVVRVRAGWPYSRIARREHWGEARRCWRQARNSPLLSSRALKRGRVSNQAEAEQQAQLRSRARARLPSSVAGGLEACRAPAQACAECWETARCVSAMTPSAMVSGLAWRASGGQRPMAVSVTSVNLSVQYARISKMGIYIGKMTSVSSSVQPLAAGCFSVMQGLPQWPKLLAAGSVKVSECDMYIYIYILLHALGDEAAGTGGVDRASFVAGALRECSIRLCRGNFCMYCACLEMLAKSSGTGFWAGMRVPTDEHGLL
jgi:hypothetical protein